MTITEVLPHVQTYAKVIEDSISPWGRRLTTFEVKCHRFVLAEFNTHRVFSRNSASSRAIPFSKQLERVMETPAIPIVWAAEQKGMQGGDEIENPEMAERQWLYARDQAVLFAQVLADEGVHKSIVNRLLEPYMYHTIVVSSTSWQNFFNQRCSPLAQPEIRVLAEMMRYAYERSRPAELREGDYHLPYVKGDVETIEWAKANAEGGDTEDEWIDSYTALLVRISAARCARVSYLTQGGKRDPEEDIKLWSRLTTADPMHASPLEHPATPAEWNEHEVEVKINGKNKWLLLPKVGNFLGWQQHRLEVEVAADWQSFA